MTSLSETLTENGEQKIETKQFRVLKRHVFVTRANRDDDQPQWDDKGSVEFSGTYPRPDAQQLGHLYGEGEYLCFEDRDYAAVIRIVVVAETVYRELRDEETS